MGKFDKYKKTTEKTDLDKYKKKSGSSFDEIEKKLEEKDQQTITKIEEGSMGGTILIIILGLITVVVWVLAIGKLV
jgi:hypothetical protein